MVGPFGHPTLMEFEKLPGLSFGARCCTEDVDLTSITVSLSIALRNALKAHGVLVFPNQGHLQPRQEVDIARLFDHDITEEHPSSSSLLFGDKGEPWLQEVPQVRLVGTAKVSEYYGTTGVCRNYSDWAADQRAWHQDGTCDTGPVPPRIGLLRSIKATSTGGDTLFVCTKRLAQQILRREREGEMFAIPPSRAQGYYRRPESSVLSRDGVAIESVNGKWITESHGPYPLIAIDDDEENESDPFCIYNWNLEYIESMDGHRLTTEDSWIYMRTLMADYLNDDQHIYRHKWVVGDLVIWDQWATLHSATARSLYNGEERLLHRIRLRGTKPPIPYSTVGNHTIHS